MRTQDFGGTASTAVTMDTEDSVVLDQPFKMSSQVMDLKLKTDLPLWPRSQAMKDLVNPVNQVRQDNVQTVGTTDPRDYNAEDVAKILT